MVIKQPLCRVSCFAKAERPTTGGSHFGETLSHLESFKTSRISAVPSAQRRGSGGWDRDTRMVFKLSDSHVHQKLRLSTSGWLTAVDSDGVRDKKGEQVRLRAEERVSHKNTSQLGKEPREPQPSHKSPKDICSLSGGILLWVNCAPPDIEALLLILQNVTLTAFKKVVRFK